MKKIIIGCVNSDVTYPLNGANLERIIKNEDGIMILTKDGGNIKLPSNRFIVNEEEFNVNE